MRVLGIWGPGIRFEVDGRPVFLGLGLDPAEAHRVVAEITARHEFPARSAAA